MMKSRHLQDFAALLAGIYAALSPIWTSDPENNKAMITMITLGILTAAVALLSLARPDTIATEGFMALLGVAFIISPWVMSFNTGFTALAWTAWIAGAVALLAGGADVQMTRTARRSGAVTN